MRRYNNFAAPVEQASTGRRRRKSRTPPRLCLNGTLGSAPPLSRRFIVYGPEELAAADKCARVQEKVERPSVDGNPEPGSGHSTEFQAREGLEEASEVDFALHSIMTATQNSFRKQLADMRENLNKVGERVCGVMLCGICRFC